MTLLLHADEELVLFIEIDSDGLEGSGPTTRHRTVHLQLLLMFGVKDFVRSRAFIEGIAEEGVRLHNLGLEGLDAENT